MKKILILICSIIMPALFVSCVEYAPGTTAGPGVMRPSVRPPNPYLPPVSAVRSYRWKQVRLTGGKVDLYLVINGKDYYIKQVRAFTNNRRSDYRSSGVPASAKIAGIFWVSQHEEDSEGIYVAESGNTVKVYTGGYDPGFMHDVRWGLIRTIRF